MKSLHTICATVGILVIGLSPIAALSDDSAKDRLDPDSRISQRALSPSGGNLFAVAPTTPAVSGRAVQFRIHYDPSKVEVASVEGCLSNLPAEIRNGLSSCRDIREKSLVQIVVSDLNVDGRIPANFELGTIEFRAVESIETARNSLRVDDIHISKPATAKGVSAEGRLEVKLNPVR